MAAEKFTGDTCFMSALRRNRCTLPSPSSPPQLLFLFCDFLAPPTACETTGQDGTGREGGQEHVMRGGSVPFVCECEEEREHAHTSENVCVFLRRHPQTALLTHLDFA